MGGKRILGLCLREVRNGVVIISLRDMAKGFIVSSVDDGDSELLRRQTILVRFGELALRSDDLDEILTESCRLVGEAFGTDLAKVIELQVDGETLLVRAGVGWKPGIVGVATTKASNDTSEGLALRTGEPIISRNIATETRFRYPPFLIDNGVKAFVNVPIIGGESRPPYGILEVDSRELRDFTESDSAFLSGYANLIAATVDRLRALRELRDEEEARRRVLETQVAERTAALALAVRRLQGVSARQIAIFDSASDGIVTINLGGSIETLNPAAARMFGCAPEELVGRDIRNLFELGPDQGNVETFVSGLYRQSASAGAVQEFSGKRRDGSTFPMEIAVNRVYLVEIDDIYLAVVRDVTERKQIDQMKSEFVSTVSHELRTPLTSIAGSLGLLAGGAAGELPKRATRLITIAHSNCERLVRLINDILDIDKIESGKIVFDLKRVEVDPLVRLAIEANSAFADSYGVRISFDAPAGQAAVIADADRLMQVLTNLLANAVEFSPQGEVVTVSVADLDRRWRITVSDRGPGIDEAFKPRIFGKFAQADASDTRQKGGTGLGLSIVKEIVTRLGGSVSFDSSPGAGAAFHVDLPAADAGQRYPAASFDGAAILHVEDDPDLLLPAAKRGD